LVLIIPAKEVLLICAVLVDHYTARSAGLPVSVKTRLGYTYTDEWRDWLTALLREDIAALTIHLRTKREMSKVPAHWDIMPDIVALRDEIAPQTLIIGNGDVRDREHGLELISTTGCDGVMIGRGVFANPFCFAAEQEYRMSNIAIRHSHILHTIFHILVLSIYCIIISTSTTSTLRKPSDRLTRSNDFSRSTSATSTAQATCANS
jgi:tRNA-dihydrouridine synthase